MTALFLALLPFLVPGQPQQRPTFGGPPQPFQDRRIRESSGVIASRKHPGLLWTMNDSGGDPVLFLTDTSGASLGAFTVSAATNIDWETLGRGRCGEAECLFIGDTGDNSERRRSVTVYRIPEPAPLNPPRDAVVDGAGAVRVEYPDGPHDVEALYVEPDGSVVLVTKGRSRGILTFRVPARAWTGGSARAERLDSLPIAASLPMGRAVTDAAISPDGRKVVVRTYRELWFFTRENDGHLTLDPARPVCDVTGLQRQGEAVDWWDGDRLVLTSERGTARDGTILLIQCPVL
ncbi:MAG TPA: hypothetical protein VLB00_13410 [Gemmatimonadales bacterium]|nr:hypothetical protein [Gemmatimonadales bacterium]